MTTLQTEKDLKNPKFLSPSKRWCNNKLPGQFTKEHDTQTKSTKNHTRDDTVYRYYEDTDTLSVYFAKASSGVVRYCEEVSDFILVSYDGDDKIVSVEIYEATKLLCCHLFDTPKTIDNKPPLALYPICYEDRDDLEVLFVCSKPPPSSITFKETEDKDIEVGMNNENNIVTLLFHNASSKLSKTLPENEREKLAEKARLRSLEIAKWSHLLDEKAYK